MIYDIITFSISNKIFAIDLQKVPVILTAREHLPDNFTFINKNYFFSFNSYDIELINLSGLLHLENCSVKENTKILVGKKEKDMFGFLVDEVKEIIDLSGVKSVNFYENTNPEEKYILGTMEITGNSLEQLKIIDVDKILKSEFENNKPLI